MMPYENLLAAISIRTLNLMLVRRPLNPAVSLVGNGVGGLTFIALRDHFTLTIGDTLPNR